MKSKINLFLTLILMTVIWCGCKKEKDYRDKYTGNWNFEVQVYKFNFDSIGQSESFKFDYTGIINKKETNELSFVYGQNSSIILSIDESGELSEFPTHYCSGNFIKNDSVHLYLRWGGLGGGLTHIVNGKKNAAKN